MPSPHRLLPGLLAAAAILALAMAFLEGINHRPDLWRGPPDEHAHRAAARYYVDHWLPPKVGDPASLDSYSRDYGYSYLNDPDPVYFVAGRFAALVSPVASDPHRALRLFNVTLLAILAFLAWRRPGAWPVFLPLLVTPQVWYIFSYFNNDGFALFLSVLAAWQAADRESLFNRYLDGPWLRNLGGLAFMGALLGLLLISKKNYFAFLALVPAAIALTRLGVGAAVLLAATGIGGAALYLEWVKPDTGTIGALVAMLFVASAGCVFMDRALRRERAIGLAKLAALPLIALAIVAPRYAWDASIHGSLRDKQVAAGKLQEQFAKPSYKPSQIQLGNPAGTFHGIDMRKRGVPLAALLQDPWNWHIRTFATATGSFGWLEFEAGTMYRVLLVMGYLAIFGLYAWTAVRTREAAAITGFAQVSAFSALIVGIALFHSWNNDFQAQGRYLFPIVAMLGLGLLQLRDRLPERALVAATAWCFALSAYSFIFIGLAQVPRSFPP